MTMDYRHYQGHTMIWEIDHFPYNPNFSGKQMVENEELSSAYIRAEKQSNNHRSKISANSTEKPLNVVFFLLLLKEKEQKMKNKLCTRVISWSTTTGLTRLINHGEKYQNKHIVQATEILRKSASSVRIVSGTIEKQ